MLVINIVCYKDDNELRIFVSVQDSYQYKSIIQCLTSMAIFKRPNLQFHGSRSVGTQRINNRTIHKLALSEFPGEPRC